MDQDGRIHAPHHTAFENYPLDRPGKIIFVGPHLRTSDHIRCIIRTISLSGARIEVAPHLPVPQNFFLQILGIHDEIGCTLTDREEEKAFVAFNMLIDPEFMHHVIRLSFETAS